MGAEKAEFTAVVGAAKTSVDARAKKDYASKTARKAALKTAKDGFNTAQGAADAKLNALKQPISDLIALIKKAGVSAEALEENDPVEPSWNAHLLGLTKDALDKGYPGQKMKGFDTHAHHIVMRKGTRSAQHAVVLSQAILRNHGIDPFFDRENLIWAPNRGHSIKYAENVLQALQSAKTKGEVIEALEEQGRKFIDGKNLT